MTPIPEVPAGGNIAIYIWIIGVLVIIIPAIITIYERKINKISDRLNTVIDDSMKRMELGSDTDKNGLEKIHEIVIKLKEMIIFIKK